MTNPAAPVDGMTSSGLCTRCQQDLVLAGDILGCPICGAHVLVSVLHASIRLNTPRARFGSRSSGYGEFGTTSHSNDRSQVACGAAPAQPRPPLPSQAPRPSSNFTELWKRLRKEGQ
jgi:hypothetical protein